MYPESISNGTGLIADICNLPNSPWNSQTDDFKKSIERAFNLRSGFKTVISTFETINAQNRASVIYSVYGEKWTKYWNIYKLEYDPLAAYIVEENGNRDVETNGDRTIAYGKIENESGSNSGTITDNGSDSNSSNNSVFGFNSITSVPSDSSSESGTTNNTETRNLNDTRNLSTSGEDSHTTFNTENEEYTVSKKGNIGYATPQKLLKEEFELWAIPFFDIVFSDVEQLIMLKVY